MRILIGIVAMSFLSACMGSGTGSSNPPPNNIIPPNVLPDETENNSFAVLLNDVRSNNAVGSVTYDSRLGLAAQTHASDMVTQGYLSHEGLNGSTIQSRATAAGYNWTWIGENIGQGQQTQASIMNSWTNSPDHHANNIHPEFEDFGLGVAGTGGEKRWVLMLGSENP